MTTVLTYGTYDMLHVGHIKLLQRARMLGDRLVVGLSTDEFNATKGKRCVIPYADRKLLLESLRVVDQVIPERCWEQKVGDVQHHDVDRFCMGSDWEGHFDFLEDHCEVIYLPRTANISTTLLKRRVRQGLGAVEAAAVAP